MKKIVVIVLALSAVLFAEAKVKGNTGFGSTLVESTESGVEFGGAYLFADVSGENEYVSAGGKIYYRWSSFEKLEELGQKLDLKKAYLKVRPSGSDIFEIAGGKLYSYYLPGNFFQLSEIYTGASRWGKTGLGAKGKITGFEFGASLPLSESYLAFQNEWGLNAALVYDFSTIKNFIPLKLGASFIFDRALQKDESYKNDFSSTVNLYYTSKVRGFVSNFNAAVSFSYNAEPFVASSIFKNVSNYKRTELKKANFLSLNLKSNFGKVAFTLEGEAGHSVEGSMIPLYAGSQINLPVIGGLSFKPKIFYYAALDSSDSEKSRQTVELYPRLWFTYEKWTFAAGYDFAFKQADKELWNFEWKVPVLVEYKF